MSMTVKDLVIKARSYRNYDSGYEISMETLRELVDVARLTSSTINKQPLKFFLSCDEETNKKVFSVTKWAGSLKNVKLPFEGNEPTAYIVICIDTDIVKNYELFYVDVGIAAEAIMLAAVEKDINGCMLGAIDPKDVSATLGFRPGLMPKLIMALGKKNEEVKLVDVPEAGNTIYYREGNTNFVPKRTLDDLII